MWSSLYHWTSEFFMSVVVLSRMLKRVIDSHVVEIT